MSAGKELAPIHSQNVTKKELQTAIRTWKKMSGQAPAELIEEYAGAIAFLEEEYDNGSYKDESIVKRLFGFWGERREKQKLQKEMKEKEAKEKEELKQKRYAEEQKKGQEKFIEEHTMGTELSVASKTGWCVHHPKAQENTQWDLVGVPQPISGFYGNVMGEGPHPVENYDFINIRRKETQMSIKNKEENTNCTYINIYKSDFVFIDSEEKNRIILNVWNDIKERGYSTFSGFPVTVNKLRIVGECVLEYDPELKNKTKVIAFTHESGETIYFRIGIANKDENPPRFELREVKPRQN